jgi:Putative addiction module component
VLDKPQNDVALEEAEISTDPEFDQYWIEVVKQRIENVKTGKSRTIPLQEVLDELERRL